MTKKSTTTINIRRDLFTGEYHPKSELIRINIKKDGSTTIDVDQKELGRGIYIHPNSVKNIEQQKGKLIGNIKRFKGDISVIDRIEEKYG